MIHRMQIEEFQQDTGYYPPQYRCTEDLISKECITCLDDVSVYSPSMEECYDDVDSAVMFAHAAAIEAYIDLMQQWLADPN